MKKLLAAICLLLLISACHSANNDGDKGKKDNPLYITPPKKQKDTAQANLIYPGEKHFSGMRQLTFGGDNAEAYFSSTGKAISFQSNNPAWGLNCDQIFFFALQGENMKDKKPQLISTGDGRTTCSYFLPGDTEILFASTHLKNKACPPQPAPRADHKYVWPIDNGYDIFVSDLHGHIKRQLTKTKGYDAEATVSPKGDKIVFTSTRSGDLELWTMNINGTGLKQVTKGLGYDGGAFFSPDGQYLVFRASRPKTPEEIKEYKDLYKQGLVAPTNMEIYTCRVDGSDLKQVTHLGHANWAPFFHPSGKKIIFSSNHVNGGFHFNLFMMNLDGSGLEQITYDPVFDAFPMFSPDGKQLIFSSERNNPQHKGINLFLADWKE
jgi:WD40 repeat protein